MGTQGLDVILGMN
jgi:hypothetical protein